MMRRLVYVCGALALMFGLALPAAAQEDTAHVRVIHAAPDAPAVDVFVDGEAVLENVGFLMISDYLELAAGEHTVAVAPAGQGEDAAVITEQPTVEAGQAYTVAVVGVDELSVAVYSDDISPVPAGKARVRALHTISDAPSVDVEVVGGPTLFQGVAFPDASDYAEVDAGTYDLRLVAAGANTVFTQWPGTELEAGTIYDIVVFGSLANLQTQVATTTPGSDDMGGGAPVVPATMPDTGMSSDIALWLGLGLMLLSAGWLSRRYARA